MSAKANPPARRPSARGFTLPEVLATMVLIGIVLPACMRGLSLSLAASTDARRKLEATALAENKLAEITATTLWQSQTGTTTGDFSPDFPEYSWEATSYTVDTDLAEVQVYVFWTSRGAVKSVSLSTMVFTAAGTGAASTATGTGPSIAPTGGTP